MSTTAISLRAASAIELNKLEHIYLEAFPPEERRPWEQIAATHSDSLLRLHAIFCNGDAVGLITTWDFGTFVYVEHLAVDISCRGGGIGAAVLTCMKAGTAGRPLVLEVEPPCELQPDTVRRVNFYKRNGFHMLPHDYVQPPYSAGLPEVELRLMSTDPEMPPEPLISLLHSKVYNKKI